MNLYDVYIIFTSKGRKNVSADQTFSQKIRGTSLEDAKTKALALVWEKGNVGRINQISITEYPKLRAPTQDQDRLHVLIKLEGGNASFEAATDGNIRVTIIDWDIQEDAPEIKEGHFRKVTSPEKLHAHIEGIRNNENIIQDL